MYNADADEKIAFVERPRVALLQQAEAVAKYGCSLYWESDSTLLIGWGPAVRIGVLRERAVRTPGMPALEMQLVCSYVLPSAFFSSSFVFCVLVAVPDECCSALTWVQV